MVEAQLVNREPLQQTGTAIDPAMAGMLGNLNIDDVRSQLHNLSMNPAPGIENAGNQIPPINQHPMYSQVIGGPALIGQGQVQGQAGGDNQMEEDLMSLDMPAYQMTATPKGIVKQLIWKLFGNKHFAYYTQDRISYHICSN